MKSAIVILATAFAATAFAQTAPAKPEAAKPVATAPAPIKTADCGTKASSQGCDKAGPKSGAVKVEAATAAASQPAGAVKK